LNLAEMSSARLVQAIDWECSFQAAQKGRIAAARSITLAKTPHLDHYAEVGVKGNRMRGCLASQAHTLGCLWVA
jgi:hypothetical protein